MAVYLKTLCIVIIYLIQVVYCGGGPCRRAWSAHKGRCYLVIKTRSVTHAAAVRHCQKYKAFLPIIKDNAEDRLIQKLLRDNDMTHTWLGLTKCNMSMCSVDGWQWQDGYKLLLDANQSTPWHSTAFKANCAILKATGYPYWDGKYCDDRFGYICQKADNDKSDKLAQGNLPNTPFSYNFSYEFEEQKAVPILDVFVDKTTRSLSSKSLSSRSPSSKSLSSTSSSSKSLSARSPSSKSLSSRSPSSKSLSSRSRSSRSISSRSPLSRSPSSRSPSALPLQGISQQTAGARTIQKDKHKDDVGSKLEAERLNKRDIENGFEKGRRSKRDVENGLEDGRPFKGDVDARLEAKRPNKGYTGNGFKRGRPFQGKVEHGFKKEIQYKDVVNNYKEEGTPYKDVVNDYKEKGTPYTDFFDDYKEGIPYAHIDNDYKEEGIHYIDFSNNYKQEGANKDDVSEKTKHVSGSKMKSDEPKGTTTVRVTTLPEDLFTQPSTERKTQTSSETRAFLALLGIWFACIVVIITVFLVIRVRQSKFLYPNTQSKPLIITVDRSVGKEDNFNTWM